jgi:hypothetical protein
VAAPSGIERVIVQHGRTEAAKQAKLVAKQVKEAGTNRTAAKGTDLESGLKVGLDSVGTDVGARGVSTGDSKVAGSAGNGGQSITGTVPGGTVPGGTVLGGTVTDGLIPKSVSTLDSTIKVKPDAGDPHIHGTGAAFQMPKPSNQISDRPALRK